MKREEIENLMQSLAMSQGFYGRLLSQIYSAPESVQEAFWRSMEAQNFTDDVDVVMFLGG